MRDWLIKEDRAMAKMVTYEPNRDCFAYRHDFIDGCDALNDLYCKYGEGGRCPFYKTKEELKQQRKRRCKK